MQEIAFQSIRNHNCSERGMPPNPLEVSTPCLKKSWIRPWHFGMHDLLENNRIYNSCPVYVSQ